MKPFEDTVIIEKEPTLDISIKEDSDAVAESITVKVKDDIDTIVKKKVDEDVKLKKPKKEKKKSKLGSF